MIFNVKNTAGKKVSVYVSPGLQLPSVYSYNTKTREASFYLIGLTDEDQCKCVTLPIKKNSSFPRKVLKMKVKFPDSYILVDGKKF